MGKIELRPDGKLTVLLESQQDVAVLAATMRAVPGTDGCTLATNSAVPIDSDNAANLLALHATRFAWTPAAIARALDELAPYALQQVSLHSTMLLKTQQRFMAQAQDAAKRRQTGEQR